MSLIFPFDSSLRGTIEEVEIIPSSLSIPYFVFPKGSFFVDNTYGFFENNRLLRPGIDYLVMSCNETIKFNDNDETLNNLMKNHYIRNVIFLISEDSKTNKSIWQVAYSGGEEETKPNEYIEYLNRTHADSLATGVENLFFDPIQGFANFIDKAKEQLTSGRLIYYKPFKEDEENSNGGLGWGKVEVAVSELKDVVTTGTDPLLLQAFVNWVRHNNEHLIYLKNKYISSVKQTIRDKSLLRVDYDQFIFTDGNKDLSKFLEHKNVILRGLTDGENIGIHGLAGSGEDYNATPAKLYQRKENEPTQPESYMLRFGEVVYIDKIPQLHYNLPVGNWRIKVISSRTNEVVRTQDINVTGNKITRTITLDKAYFDLITGYDNLFAYIVELDNGEERFTSNNYEVAKCVLNKSYTGNSFDIKFRSKRLTDIELNRIIGEVIVSRETANEPTGNLTLNCRFGEEDPYPVSFSMNKGVKEVTIQVDFRKRNPTTGNSYKFEIINRNVILKTLIGYTKGSLSETPQIYITSIGDEGVQHLFPEFDVNSPVIVMINPFDVDIEYTSLAIKGLNAYNVGIQYPSTGFIKDKRTGRYYSAFIGRQNGLCEVSVYNLRFGWTTNTITWNFTTNIPMFSNNAMKRVEISSYLESVVMVENDTIYTMAFPREVIIDDPTTEFIFGIWSADLNFRTSNLIKVSADGKFRLKLYAKNPLTELTLYLGGNPRLTLVNDIKNGLYLTMPNSSYGNMVKLNNQTVLRVVNSTNNTYTFTKLTKEQRVAYANSINGVEIRYNGNEIFNQNSHTLTAGRVLDIPFTFTDYEKIGNNLNSIFPYSISETNPDGIIRVLPPNELLYFTADINKTEMFVNNLVDNGEYLLNTNEQLLKLTFITKPEVYVSSVVYKENYIRMINNYDTTDGENSISVFEVRLNTPVRNTPTHMLSVDVNLSNGERMTFYKELLFKS